MLLPAHPSFRPFDQLSRLAPMAPGNTFLPYFLSGEGSWGEEVEGGGGEEQEGEGGGRQKE